MLKEDFTRERKDRHKVTQEDFTPKDIVNSMLDNVDESQYSELSRTFLDTSCGTGNILCEVLNRKLKFCNGVDDMLVAIKSIYGVEMMADNVVVCRNNLYNIVIGKFKDIDKDTDDKLRSIIKYNIIWYDSLLFDYDSFKPIQEYGEEVSFEIVPDEDDTYFPMWHRKDANSMTLF